SKLHSSCAKHKCRCHAASVCNSSCCDDRNVDCVNHLRHENHRCIFTDVSACFCSLCHDGICSAALHSLCQSHACYNRDDLYACFLPHLHVFFRASGTGCHDFDALFHDDF